MSASLEFGLSEKQVFNQFPREVLSEVMQRGIPRKLLSGEYLCHQGDSWPCVVLVIDGRLRWLMLSASGKEHQLFALESGEVFWAHSLFDDQPMPASLVADKQVEALVWPREIILPYLKRYPDVMWEVTGLLTRIMRRAREIIYGLAFQPVASRLAGYLLDNLQDAEQDTFEREMTLEDIAAILATSPEVVCRLLYQFQADEILKVNRTQITLQDRAALQDLVEGV
jgi:CRP/FNR family transcriptional regulator